MRNSKQSLGWGRKSVKSNKSCLNRLLGSNFSTSGDEDVSLSPATGRAPFTGEAGDRCGRWGSGCSAGCFLTALYILGWPALGTCQRELTASFGNLDFSVSGMGHLHMQKYFTFHLALRENLSSKF